MSGQAADRSRSKRGVAWTGARYFRATPRTLRCTLSPQPFLTAAYRRRICHLLLRVLSRRVHPPTLHPPSCCHPSWDDEQAGQLAFHMPTHSVRESDARATCHSARSRSPGLRQKRQGSAFLARVSAWQFCTPDSASTGCQIARCTSSARRWLLMADRAAIGPNATDAERAYSPPAHGERTKHEAREECPWQFVSVMPSHSSQP